MFTGCALKSRAWRLIAQGLVWPLVVVERKPPADAPARLQHRAIRLDEHFLIFQAAPQPLDEDVVQKTPFAVHADPHARGLKFIQERGAGKLHALIGVEK